MDERVDIVKQNGARIRKAGTFLSRCGPSLFERGDF